MYTDYYVWSQNLKMYFIKGDFCSLIKNLKMNKDNVIKKGLMLSEMEALDRIRVIDERKMNEHLLIYQVYS